MIIFTKIWKSIHCSGFITQNVHPAQNSFTTYTTTAIIIQTNKQPYIPNSSRNAYSLADSISPIRLPNLSQSLYPIILSNFSSAPKKFTVSIKEKCEADFVYLTGGCGKTYAEVNVPIPTLGIYVKNRDRICPITIEYTKNECCSLSFCYENYHISRKGLRKHFLKICPLITQHHKFRNYFHNNEQHPLGLKHKVRWNFPYNRNFQVLSYYKKLK